MNTRCASAARATGGRHAPALSIVMPVRNEAALMRAALLRVAPLRARGAEVIVVDGASGDGTAQRARGLADTVLDSAPGRAVQMNAGAARARADTLLFLHVDTALPADADRLIAQALAAPARAWGRFDVRIAGRSRWLPLVAWSMNLRSRLSGIATGDQAIFVRRAAFDAVGGFPPIALMEDIALSRALRRLSAPACLRARVITSGRRWERDGALRTIALMWRLRLAYFLGADPARLAHRYDGAPR